MAEVDPAKALKEFKPAKEFFVGIDSDGCAFDSMGIKQRECFCPWMIAYFGLQPVALAARECKEFADL
ncbi:MAG: HAD family hydrolase, partial [Planctomycetota bacterium]